MTDVTTSATIASLRAEVERLKAELQGEREDVAACRAEVNRLSKYAERLLSENVRLSNEAAELREAHAFVACENARLTNDVGVVGNQLAMERDDHAATRKALNTARERAGVLEAEVKACRLYDEAITADEQEVGWHAKEAARRETDRTNALDAAKFGGA